MPILIQPNKKISIPSTIHLRLWKCCKRQLKGQDKGKEKGIIQRTGEGIRSCKPALLLEMRERQTGK